MRVAADRLSVRWYLGYDLHEPLPDHSNLTRTRERFGLPIFRRFFEEIVEMHLSYQSDYDHLRSRHPTCIGL